MGANSGFVFRLMTAVALLAASVACRETAPPSPAAVPSGTGPATPAQTIDFNDINLPEARLRITREDSSSTPAEVLRLPVKIADDIQSRGRGLMFVRRLPANSGMVFLYHRPTEGSFYMKNTLIPLDIAFWGEDRRIHQIIQMPPCRADPCPTYKPKLPFTSALEVNRGLLNQKGVRVGDTVTLTAQTTQGQAPG